MIREEHQKYWTQEQIKTMCKEVQVVPDVEIAWAREALDKLNRGNHLLISGESGFGKSVVVKHFCSLRGYQAVSFLPCELTGFEFSTLDSDSRIAVADDIGRTYFTTHRQTLIRLLDGGLVSTNPKCKAILSFVANIQFIFCSNYKDLLLEDTALRRRIIEVSANVPAFQKVRREEAEIPQEEIREASVQPSPPSPETPQLIEGSRSEAEDGIPNRKE